MTTIPQTLGEQTRSFPKIRYFNQDFVDLYNKTWTWIDDHYTYDGNSPKVFISPHCTELRSIDACFSTFFLVYNNKNYPSFPQLDYFYNKQEEDGAIRSIYSLGKGKPVFSKNNPDSLGLPLFSWVEFNLYHKLGNKKRIREIIEPLEKYYAWLERNYMDETGLYHSPLESTGMINSPRHKARYLIDFNAVQAINAFYMSELGSILNDRDISFNYKRRYFALKTKINQKMWNSDRGFYFDLDKNQNQLPVKTIAAYWSLIAGIPNDSRFEMLLEKLIDPQVFGTPNPFPSLAADEAEFSSEGEGYCGSVFPYLTFMVIKGLEKYSAHTLARSLSIRHFYNVMDTLNPDGSESGTTYEAYKPFTNGPASWKKNPQFPMKEHFMQIGLSTLSLMIENIIGLNISLPRKTVQWIVPTLETMGIQNLSLKRNNITILVSKTNRGWEIRLESEKLYYFTIEIPDRMKKTLPIPSGKCSMLIDKI